MTLRFASTSTAKWVRVTIDNPPVNATSHAVRARLMAALDEAAGSGAERVVLSGAGRTFVAGPPRGSSTHVRQPPHVPDIVSQN